MTYFLLGLVALGLIMVLLNWLANAKPRDVLRSLKWIALGVVGAVVVLLILTRNINLIWAVGAAALPWLIRLQSLRQIWRSMRGPSKGQTSRISSRFFDMELDHDSGAMDGRIKEGQFAGALLSELSLDEGKVLFSEVTDAGDERSQRLLEAFLDRAHGAAWRSSTEQQEHQQGHRQEKSQSQSPGGAMTRQEALELLGLSEGAGEKEIKEAHRRIMKQVHPDTGGSTYLAARVNEAKDLLLKT